MIQIKNELSYLLNYYIKNHCMYKLHLKIIKYYLKHIHKIMNFQQQNFLTIFPLTIKSTSAVKSKTLFLKLTILTVHLLDLQL